MTDVVEEGALKEGLHPRPSTFRAVISHLLGPLQRCAWHTYTHISYREDMHKLVYGTDATNGPFVAHHTVRGSTEARISLGLVVIKA
jgi:hypothetical protein